MYKNMKHLHGRTTDRQTDRQTERQTDRQTGRQADRQTDMQTDLDKLFYLCKGALPPQPPYVCVRAVCVTWVDV